MKKKSWVLWFTMVLMTFAVMAGGCGGGTDGSTDVDVTLLGLELSVGELSPTFSPSVTNYTATVDSATASIIVTATAAAPDDVKISVNTVNVGSGSGYVVSLNEGTNTINIDVSALDDSDALITYAVVVTRGEASEEGKEGFYIPMPVTQEELDDIERNGRIDLKLDSMLLPDGSYVKDFLDVPLPWSVTDNSSASFIRQAATPITRVQFNAAIARIMKRAWDLTNRDLDDSTRNTNFEVRDDNEKAKEQDHGNGVKFGQKRYVYIYGVYGSLGDLDRKGFNPAMHGNGGCGHDMYGMDCVGFVRECLAAADIPATPSISPIPNTFTPNGLSPWFPNNSPLVVVDKSEEIGNTPPLPGDILVYSGHVALCVRLDTDGDGVTEIAIAHSVGRTNVPSYSCQEYLNSQDLDASQIGGELGSNGPHAQNYQWTLEQNKYPRRETRRLRIVPREVAAEICYITLTWGDNPRDLDSHLVGPDSNGGSFHVDYRNREVTDANLDVDDTSSYGPEIITLRTLRPGIYRYFVHHYSGSGSLSTSEAVVTLNVNNAGDISGMQRTKSFAVPLQGEGLVWNVFNIRVDEQNHASLETVNTITPNFEGYSAVQVMRSSKVK
jgi:hypothetical protein